MLLKFQRLSGLVGASFFSKIITLQHFFYWAPLLTMEGCLQGSDCRPQLISGTGEFFYSGGLAMTYIGEESILPQRSPIVLVRRDIQNSSYSSLVSPFGQTANRKRRKRQSTTPLTLHSFLTQPHDRPPPLTYSGFTPVPPPSPFPRTYIHYCDPDMCLYRCIYGM